MKKNNKHFTGWLRAFFIVALVFLAVGLGTLGSVHSLGGSYSLSPKRSGDGKEPAIVFSLSEPTHGEEGHNHRDLYIKQVYINVGIVYSEYGESATLRLQRGTGASSGFYSYAEVDIVNFFETAQDEATEETRTEGDMLFNWVAFPVPEAGWRFSTYPFFRLTARNSSVLINEIVFVGNESSGEGEDVIFEVEIHDTSVLPYDTAKGETAATALEKASAIIDKQRMPDLAQSSFNRFTREEAVTLMTIAEMKQGGTFDGENVYHADSVYGAFGIDLIAIGTAIFGVSPFGLRFIPFLASFGVLVFGFLFVRRLLKSDKAGLVFAVIYALSGLSISLGHLGAPLMIGLCFFMASLYFCYCFFDGGIKKANLVSALPVLFSGLFAALAICVNGAFLIPLLGVIGLFVAGLVRQSNAGREKLDAAVDEAEIDEEKIANSTESEAPVHAGKQKVAKVLAENKFKSRVAVALFCSFLVLGSLLVSLLSILPLFSTYVKAFDDPASPTKSVFSFILQTFIGGFASNNSVAAHSAWSPIYVLFRGTGDMYAVTAAGILPALVAIIFGICGAIFAIIRLVRGGSKEELTTTVLLFVGFALSLITAAFGGLTFLTLAYLFLFVLAALLAGEIPEDSAISSEDGPTVILEKKKRGKTLLIVGLVLLAVYFALFAVFTFSIPLPDALLTALLG